MKTSKIPITMALLVSAIALPITAGAADGSDAGSIIENADVTLVSTAGFDSSETVAIPSTSTGSTSVENKAPCEKKRYNQPAEGDENHEDYFIHTYSNGTRAFIPFDPSAKVRSVYYNTENGGSLTEDTDVDALKKLGSDTPLKDEICYEVVEFLDGTKALFPFGRTSS